MNTLTDIERALLPGIVQNAEEISKKLPEDQKQRVLDFIDGMMFATNKYDRRAGKESV